MVLLIAEFTMREGQVDAALHLVEAVKQQAEAEQPGTLVYLVHRTLDKDGNPSRTLLFYEEYSDDAALQAHLSSSSWHAIATNWSTYFEGESTHDIESKMLTRIAAFERPGQIPVVAG